ncbi:unnamed protein product, partial [Sphacelaria rigidula]
VQDSVSPSQAWRRLIQHYHASGYKERKRLITQFYGLKIELEEHPREYLLRIDRLVRELKRIGRPVDPKDVSALIISGLSSQYDAEFRILEQERRSHGSNNRGGKRSTTREKNNASRQNGRADTSPRDGESKTSRAGCYSCEGPHKPSECPNRPKTPSTSGNHPRSFLAKSTLGAGLTAKMSKASNRLVEENKDEEFGVADSGATQHMTSSSAYFQEYQPASPSDQVETVDGKLLRVAGYGLLQFLVDQECGDFTGATEELELARVTYVPQLDQHKLLSATELSRAPGAPLRIYPAAAAICASQDAQSLTFRRLQASSNLQQVKLRRRPAEPRNHTKHSSSATLLSSKTSSRNKMEFHGALGHSGEEITRNTAKMAGIRLTGEWQPCTSCSEARVRRYSVPNTTETRAKSRAGRFYVDLAGPFPKPSLSGKRYAMLCVDDYSHFKIVRFLKHEGQAAGALIDIIASHISPAGLKIGIIRTNRGGEFEGEFQNLLNSLSIKPEKTPPHTPQYNGVAERALGIMRDKTVALLRGLEEGKTNRLWAEAMQYACDTSNMCVTSSLDEGVTPYELWYGNKPSLSGILPLGTVGYMRHHSPPNKLAPGGHKHILLG